MDFKKILDFVDKNKKEYLAKELESNKKKRGLFFKGFKHKFYRRK